jgi:Ca-activated chloride channel family protein
MVAIAALVVAALTAPAEARADGMIIIEHPPRVVPSGHFSFAPLTVTYHHVSVSITDLVAVTTVDEEFFNPNPERLEGTYVFPLPEGAQIDKLSMDIGGTMTDAELMPADKARAYYEDIVRKMKDPALLEYAGRGAFRLRIYPIEPRSGKRVRITYTQLLKSDAGLVEYVYPLSTEKFSSAALKDVFVRVSLDGKDPLKSVFSPTHAVEIKRADDRRAVIGWEARDVWPDTDFKLIFSRSPSVLGIDLSASRAAGEDGYFMLLASPGNTAEKAEIQPKDVCFVLDTSGSMAGAKLDQAKGALRFCLANLGANDRFEIVRFSTEAEGLFGGLVPADTAHRDRAAAFVDGMHATGGTAIGDALAQALALRRAVASAGPTGQREQGRLSIVVFLTDGIPTVGETSEDALVASVSAAGASTRIFSFGIGTDVNTHLLDRIAGSTRAASQYVMPGEDIELKVSSFFSKVGDPVLTNLSLRVSNPAVRITQLMPAALPDLFNGDVLAVLGRYGGSGSATVTIAGTFNGKPHEFSAAVDFPAGTTGASYIPRLWATRRVGWLLDQVRMNGESAELRDEITRLARAFGIVTPYTAYLVLEDEESRNVPMSMRSFQELQDDTGAVANAREKLDSVRKESASESSRAGAGAVENSVAVQQMRDAVTVPQAAPAPGLAKTTAPVSASAGSGSPGGYRASLTRNYAQQVQVVNGRAFYENGGTWTDSTAQAGTRLVQRKIRFGSEEYFGFLAKNPGAAAWLALGTNVDVVIDATLVSIRE